MKIKFTAFLLIVIFSLSFAGCQLTSNTYQVDGRGLDELITLLIPTGYEKGSDVTNSPGGEILQKTWDNDDYSICLSILSYKGKGIMGADGDIGYYSQGFAATTLINQSSTTAYISYSGTSEGSKPVNENHVNAIFPHGEYVLSLDIENRKEDTVTEEQKTLLYNLLQTAEFHPLTENNTSD